MAVQIGTPQNLRAGGAGAVPPYALTSAQYLARSIAIAVYPIMESGQLCLAAADEKAEAAIEVFKQRLAPCAPASIADPDAWAASKVGDLLKAVKNFDGDVWYGSMPGSEPLLVIKQASIELKQMSLEDAVRRAHLAQVADALRDGLPVPDEVLEEYRLTIESMTAREVQ
jgi:hypothetical protein